MKRGFACAMLLLAAQAAWPADATLPSGADIDFDVNGVGADLTATRDSERFRSDRLRAGTLLTYESPYDYMGIAGGGTRYRQDGWSAERYTVGGVVKKIERATGAGLHASAALSSVGDHLRLVGEGTWNVRAGDRTGFELLGQRDFVETRAGLEAGTMTNFVAASVDHALTERLTLIGLAGLQYFSDDNLRGHLRGRLIYSLLPEQGLSVQLRARAYESSRAGGVLYFNPETYERADIGLRLRRSIGDWRVLAAAGAGRERIDRSVENPTHYLEAGAERRFANRVSLALNLTVTRSSDSNNASGGTYSWRYFRAVLIVPF